MKGETNMKTCMLLAALAALIPLSPRTSRAEEGLKPSPLIARVLGTWKGPAMVKVGGQSVKATWTMACTEAAGGFAAECRFSAKGIPGLENYLGSSILGVDPATQTVHWYWVTNGGEVHDHAGAFPKGDQLDLPYQNGGRLVESFKVAISGKTMKWSATTYDGKGNEVFACVADGKK
jgi:hypothetical protein